ncbi:MAG: MFS transporter [Dehalococcoidales bacterium]|nr:MFS transporter [Dehalococcoidales bacterium]MDZ4231121.1 MFS transporter [Dehalococcoidales bacterium]
MALRSVWQSDSGSSLDGEGMSYYGWVVVGALFLVGVISFGISTSFGVFFKPLIEDFGSSRMLTSGIFSVYIVLGSFFGVLSGWGLDRYGAKIVVILAGLFTGLGLLLTSRASVPWHLFISYSLLLAIGIGPIYTIMMSTTSKWFDRRRVLAVGVVGAGMGVGPMLVAPFATWLIERYDWNTSYFVMGIIALVTITPCALLLRRVPGEASTLVLSDPSATGAPGKQGNNSQMDGLSIRQAAKTRNFWLLFAAWFFLAFCILMVLTHIVPHAIDSGITPAGAASILSLLSAVTVIGRLLIGRVSDIAGRRLAAIICVLLLAGGILLLMQPFNLGLLYLFAVIFGLSNGGIGPPIVAQFGDIFGLRNLGMIMGVLNVAWGAGAALGSAFAGYIFDTRGSYIPAFLIALVATLITAGLVLLLRMPPGNWERRKAVIPPPA